MRSARAQLVHRRAALFGRCALPARAPKRSRDQRGAAAVEFALILPVVLTLIYGIITAGLSYTNAVGLTNAVREGARFGATAIIPSAAVGLNWQKDVIRRVQETQLDEAASAETTICVDLIVIGGTASSIPAYCQKGATSVSTTLPQCAASVCPPSISSVTVSNYAACAVRVWATRPFNITVVFPIWKDWQSTMVKTSVARYERTCPV